MRRLSIIHSGLELDFFHKCIELANSPTISQHTTQSVQSSRLNNFLSFFKHKNVPRNQEIKDDKLDSLSSSNVSISKESHLETTSLSEKQTGAQSKPMNLVIANLELVNFSRNHIGDEGLNLFTECIVNQQPNPTGSNASHLQEIHLSKCSLTSKSVNQMFTSLSFSKSLTHLDLSFNSLKEDPTVKIHDS
jgi:hypothetical protein